MSTQQLPPEPAAPSQSTAGSEATKPSTVSAASPTAPDHNGQAVQSTVEPEAEKPSKKRETSAWIALLGTIAAALIGGVTAVEVARIGHSPSSSPMPGPTVVFSTIPAPSPTAPGPTVATGTIPPPSLTPATNTVSYLCTGSAPDGIVIGYGPDDREDAPSSLPFSVSEPLQTTQEYEIFATLGGGVGSEVTCTLSVTAAGHTVTDTQIATGSNIANPVIRYVGGQWIAGD